MPNRVTYGAKAVTWDYEFLRQFDDGRNICVNLTEQEVVALLTVTSNQMTWSTRWFNAASDVPARFAANLQRALLDQTDCAGQPVATNEKVTEYVYTMAVESGDEMCVLRVEYIGGKPFLEMDCGCGKREYFALQSASVNPQTGAVDSALDSVPDYIQSPPVTGDAQSCYADKLAAIMQSALVAFVPAWFDYAVEGAQAFAPVATTALIGGVEIYQTIARVLSGELALDPDNIGYTSAEIEAAILGPEFKQWIIDRLGENTRINRFALLSFAQRTLFNSAVNTPTPISPVLSVWAYMANLEALNARLSVAASECASGQSVPSVTDFETFGVGGTQYWQLVINAGIPYGTTFDLTPYMPNDRIISYYIQGVPGVDTNAGLTDAGGNEVGNGHVGTYPDFGAGYLVNQSAPYDMAVQPRAQAFADDAALPLSTFTGKNGVYNGVVGIKVPSNIGNAEDGAYLSLVVVWGVL